MKSQVVLRGVVCSILAFTSTVFAQTDQAPASAAATGPIAFAGAEGFGAASLGGRGLGIVTPRVLFVTNLLDRINDPVSGRPITAPGSFRAALEAEGPRFVLFKVGGTIVLNEGLRVDRPYLYVAGQTAPSPGITIAHRGIAVRTNDVVFRYLRFRMYFDETLDYLQGRYMQCLTIDRHGNRLQIQANRPVDNIILDHCSFAWGIDDTIGIGEYVRHVTVQWCIMAEGARYGMDYGPSGSALLSAVDTGSTAPQVYTRLTLHHNLMAHNHSRCPRATTGEYYDLRNNVTYNWEDSWPAQMPCPAQINLVNNLFLAGLDSPRVNDNRKEALLISGQQDPVGMTRVYLSGNIAPLRLSTSQPQWDIGVSYLMRNIGSNCPPGTPSSVIYCQYRLNTTALQAPYMLASPIPAPPVITQTTTMGATAVLQKAGASGLFRDPVDTRLVNEVQWVIDKKPFTEPAPGYNPDSDPNLRRIGPSWGPIVDVLWFQPTNDPERRCLPRQYRMLPGQTMRAAQIAMLSRMNHVFPDGTTLPRDIEAVLAHPETYVFTLEKRVIPDLALIQSLYPANLSPSLPTDSDQDGIPNSYELMLGTDPFRFDSLHDRNQDGYLNIEDYLDSLAG